MASRGASHIAALLKSIQFSSRNRFDRVLEKVKITSIGDGKCFGELKLHDDHTNPMGGLHGGLSCTLVDTLSTFALMSHLGETGPAARHVSVDIHVSFLKGAKVNDDILIEASVVKSGKSVAFLDVEIKNKATGDLLVKASHTKFIMQSK